MKTLLSFLCVLLLAASLSAQGLHSNTFTTTGRDPSVNGIISLANTGIGYHKLTWVKTGTVSACAVQLDSSVDGVTWTSGGAITTQNCASNGQTAYVSGVFNYVTINVTSLSGGGTITVTWNGSTFNPGGGGGSGTVTSITADGGLTGGTITTSGVISLAPPTFQAIAAQTTSIGIPDTTDINVYLNYIPAVNSLNPLPDGLINGQKCFISANPGLGTASHQWNISVADGDAFTGIHIDGTTGIPPLGVILLWDSDAGVWSVVSASDTVTFD